MTLLDNEKKMQAGVREPVRWAWKISKGVRWRVALICTLGIVRVGASLSFVWVSKMLIDAATEQSTPVRTIWTLAAILASCMLLDLALSQLRSYVGSLASQRLANSMRRRIYKYQLQGDICGDRRHSGDILNRITIDIGSVVGTIFDTLPDIVLMIVQLVAAFWMLYVMNPTLAVCALVISPVCIVASKLYIRKMRRINADIRRDESLIHTNLQEGIQHRVVVQTLECAPEITGRFERLQDTLFGNIIRRTKVNIYTRFTVRMGFIIGYLVAFIWSVFGLHSGAITYGIMTAFLQLVGRIQGPVSSLSNTIPSLVRTVTAIDRLAEIYPADVMDKGHDMDDDVSSIVDKPGDDGIGVRVSDIVFAYPGTGKKVFDGFSYDFAPCSKTVIMGETGVGKSTLTKLILALLHPQSGSVEVYSSAGSIPVGADTRRFMTYVPQGNSLLHGTIRDNLLLGNADATDEDMRKALDIAVANFVYDLPDGLDTQCGELGGLLSEGQCQRIAIARALLRECPILILDEFNSSLDQATAETLMQRLMAARPNATIIFISHRPEVVTYSDAVLNLECK